MDWPISCIRSLCHTGNKHYYTVLIILAWVHSDSGTRPFMIYLIFSWVWIWVHWVFHFDLIHSRWLFSRFMLFQLISISGFYRNEAFYICFSCSLILQNICQWSNFIEKLTLWCKITVIWIVKRMTLHAAFVISINSMYQHQTSRLDLYYHPTCTGQLP